MYARRCTLPESGRAVKNYVVVTQGVLKYNIMKRTTAD